MNVLKPDPRSTEDPPAPISAELSAFLSRAHSSVVVLGKLRMAGNERAAFTCRQLLLEAALGPASDELVSSVILDLSATFGGENRSGPEGRPYYKSYIEILAGLPAFALKQAAWDFHKGRAGSGLFMPKAPEVRQLAEAKAHPFRKELEQILRVLAAPPSTTLLPAGRKRIVDGFHRAPRKPQKKGRARLRAQVARRTPS